jgi:isoleucyl-tRNA synthetase
MPGRGWIYKGHDVMPWCWRCGTGISQHEIVTEGYVEKTDPGLTVRFPLLGRWGDGEAKESLLVWTTTPWTLTSNVAAAVGPDLTYVRSAGQVLYLSKGTSRCSRANSKIGRQRDGALRHRPLTIRRSAKESIKRFVEEVSDAEGTGIVHIAPAVALNTSLGKRDNLLVIAPLTER